MRSLAPDPRIGERKFMPLTPEIAECPQLKVLSVEGSIYFGAVDHVESHLETLRELARDQKHLLLVTRNGRSLGNTLVHLETAEALRDAG